MAINNGADELKEFSKWMINVGEGGEDRDNDGYAEIQIPKDTLITSTSDPIQSFVNSMYPTFSGNNCDASYSYCRAILGPKNDDIDAINEYMISKMKSAEKTYMSVDVLCRTEGNGLLFENTCSTEFLNTVKCYGIPNCELKLRVGAFVALLRNIDPIQRICNGTRLVITRLGDHVLEGQILSGNNAGHRVFISRMSLTPSDSRIPFRFQRRQFQLMVSFAMTINKIEGKSLVNVGLLLRRPVFKYGQLYAAISRVTSRSGLKILICDKDGKPMRLTMNAVYKEVFQNL